MLLGCRLPIRGSISRALVARARARGAWWWGARPTTCWPRALGRASLLEGRKRTRCPTCAPSAGESPTRSVPSSLSLSLSLSLSKSDTFFLTCCLKERRLRRRCRVRGPHLHGTVTLPSLHFFLPPSPPHPLPPLRPASSSLKPVLPPFSPSPVRSNRSAVW